MFDARFHLYRDWNRWPYLSGLLLPAEKVAPPPLRRHLFFPQPHAGFFAVGEVDLSPPKCGTDFLARFFAAAKPSAAKRDDPIRQMFMAEFATVPLAAGIEPETS